MSAVSAASSGPGSSSTESGTRLDRQAGVDPLTELPNYRAFRDRLESEVSRARRHGRSLTVAVVDVDRFGEASDRVGHEESEQSFAAIVRSAVRDEERPRDGAARRPNARRSRSGYATSMPLPPQTTATAAIAPTSASRSIRSPGIGSMTSSVRPPLSQSAPPKTRH